MKEVSFLDIPWKNGIAIEQGKNRVKINEGMYFVCHRVPHSPQRPVEGSLGLVVKRALQDKGELDGLWYTDFEKCDEIYGKGIFIVGISVEI